MILIAYVRRRSLGLITAARRFNTTTKIDNDAQLRNVFGHDHRAWANASYLYAHIITEFVSNVKPEHTLRILAQSEAPVMKWVRSKLRVNRSREQRDVWETVTAISAYFITMKSLCPLFRATDGEEVDTDAGLGDWFEKLMAVWLAQPYPKVTWNLAKEVTDMIEIWRSDVIRRMIS